MNVAWYHRLQRLQYRAGTRTRNLVALPVGAKCWDGWERKGEIIDMLQNCHDRVTVAGWQVFSPKWKL